MVVEQEGCPPEDVGVESLLSVVVLEGLLPVDGSEVEDAAGGPAWQETEQVAEIGPGLDVVELGAGEQGDEGCVDFAAAVVAVAEPGFPPGGLAPQGTPGAVLLQRKATGDESHL